jgi:predicted nucleic acid-binding protein
MRVYMDTSVVMGRVLGEPGAIDDWSEWEPAISIELIRVELHRVVDRLRLRDRLTNLEFSDLRSSVQKMIRGFEIVPLSRAVLTRAGDPFPTVLGTLDAIHLASALLWTEETGDAITFLTHDLQLAMAAKACGLEVQTSP